MDEEMERFTVMEEDNRVTRESQCHSCNNSEGGRKCRALGIKPPEYYLSSQGVKCPRYKK